jgi:hypothetical protein
MSVSMPTAARPGGRAAWATIVAALAALTLCSAAQAASTHPFAQEWSTGAGCLPHDIATDAAGNVYVMCGGETSDGHVGALRKFSPSGVAIPFTASKPYISGNEINENPASRTRSFGDRAYIAVDKSSARPGWIYVADLQTPAYNKNGEEEGSSGNIDIFNPSGEYVTSIVSGEQTGYVSGIGVDKDGFIYAVYEGGFFHAHARVMKFSPQNFKPIRQVFIANFEYFGGPCCLRVRPDNNGAAWVGWGSYFFDGAGGSHENFGKYEADQFSTDLRPGDKNPDAILAEESPYLREAFPGANCPLVYSPSETAPPCQLEGKSFNVDPLTNDVYALHEVFLPGGAGTGKPIITPYSEGRAGDPVHQNGPSFGSGKLNAESHGVEVDLHGNVWTTTSPNKVVEFSRGATLPAVVTKPAAVADIGHEDATLRATIDPAGGGPITECRVSWGPLSSEPSYSSPGSPAKCTQPTPYPDGGPVEVSAHVTGLVPLHKYDFRFEAANAAGEVFGADRAFEARAVLKVETKPATGVDRHQATLNGQLEPDGIPTEYWFEYGPNTQYGQTTLDSEGKGTSVSAPPGQLESTPVTLSHLQGGHRYHYRLVARNSIGVTYGEDLTLRTVAAPAISGMGAEHVAETSADVHAFIDTIGYPTTYRFEYGPTSAYGSATEDQEVNGSTPVRVEAHLANLPAGSTIHYRIVATNEWGTTTSADTTFSFRPPNCPNEHIRQVTAASYLPDCRAYELVSPTYAGAVQFLPGEALLNFGVNFPLDEAVQTPQNLGYATSPSRFVYWGGLGSVEGVNSPNTFLDVYTATRTNRGWVSTMPGLKGSEAKLTFGRTCSEDLSLCADHAGQRLSFNATTGEFEVLPPSNAPYLYKADGKRLGRLPSNVSLVPGGTQFHGDWMFSGDFSHYFFSTQMKFAPNGNTEIPGSVYDDNIASGEVKVISYDEHGNPIQAEPSVAGDPHRVTGIVGTSQDGSMVLMAGTTNPYCNVHEFPWTCPHVTSYPARLYMRNVPEERTYEVSREKEVNFVGMTRDGGKVFFTTTEQMIPGTGPGEDNDESRDLYVWEAKDDSLHLISREGGLGNDDGCSASWVAKCGVEPLTPLESDFSEHSELKTRTEGIDDVLAKDSGDIYFYSPEDLVPGEVGGDGQRNLYLYRDGHLHFVATLEPDKQIERSTISLDGSHAAFMTRSQLTGYENFGQKEVYTYDAGSGSLLCASCNLEGKAPKKGDQVIGVAEAGPFMADDGRTFFTTKESLVPQDTDGIRDVYEYVDGRPQLITSGTGDRENTGGLETVKAFFGTLQIGLEAVSRDGTDVYFATFETLAPEDHNGNFLKFYDARAGGGFDFTPELGPCAAADECHGASSQAPAKAQIGTGATYSGGGNLPNPRRHRKHHHKHHKHHRHHHRNGGHR